MQFRFLEMATLILDLPLYIKKPQIHFGFEDSF